MKLGKYRHYKGKFYKVIGIARDSETLAKVVVYKSMYSSRKFGRNALWVRPKRMFTGYVKVKGKKVLRFKFAG